MNPQPRTPFPWQLEGRDFLLNGGSLLAHDPGLGKSYAALMADAVSDPDRLYPLLIGCPSVAVGVWVREVGLVAPGAVVQVLVSGKAIDPAAEFVVVSLDLPARNAETLVVLSQQKWRRVIIDEAHKLKSNAAARTREWFTGPRPLVSLGINPAWLLTGTPAPNGRADELYPLIMATSAARLGRFQTYETFTEHYCMFKRVKHGRGMSRVISGTNPVTRSDLNDRLKGWMQRRKISDDDMPPVIRRVVPLQVTDLKIYDELMDSVEGRALQRSIEAGDLSELNALEDSSLSRMRRSLSQAKARAAVNWVKNLLEDGIDKVVVFAWHIDAIDTMEAELTAAGVPVVKVTGATNAAAKTAAVATFQTGSGQCVFLGQSAAAGVAITLTAAHRMCIVEMCWTPGDNAQVEGRCRRMGQKSTVVVDYLVAAGTVDEIVAATVVRKTAEISALGA